MATVDSAADGASGSDADNGFDAIANSALLRGSTLIKLGLLREIGSLSRQLEKKMIFFEKLTQHQDTEESLLDSDPEVETAQQPRPHVDPEAEAELRAQIKKTEGELEHLKLVAVMSLYALRVAASVRGNHELAAQIAALLDDLANGPGAGKTFDTAALGIIPGLPSDILAADNGQISPVSTNSTTLPVPTNSTTLPAAVSDKSPSDSLADTLFDDLYNEFNEDSSKHLDLVASSKARSGYETNPYFSSDEDSVAEDTNEPDAVASF